MHTIGREDPGTSTTAVALCMNSPIAWSMTPLQLAVFLQLCKLQIVDAGPHSLLPHVMDALLALARRPWWDRGVADIPDEPDPQRPAPPDRPLHTEDSEGTPTVVAFVIKNLAINLFLRQCDELSMTRAQQQVFWNLCNLQVADVSASSLLPNVLDELLTLARQSWWDCNVAGIPDEIEPESGLPA